MILLWIAVGIIAIIAMSIISFKKKSFAFLVILGMLGLFGAVGILGGIEHHFSIFSYPHNVTYVHEPDTVRKNIVEVKKVVEIQKNISIPAFDLDTEKTLVLLDKSGSMKDLSTKMYLDNANYFARDREIWFFDTKLYKDANPDELVFEGDTDIYLALNEAVKDGFETVILCSDMEQTVDNSSLDLNDQVKLFIISPAALGDANEALEQLIYCSEVNSIQSVVIE